MNDENTKATETTNGAASALSAGLDGSARIEYRYLNMDTGRFHETQEDMVKCLGKGSLLRAIPNYQHNQCLIAGGRKEFSEVAAVIKCKRLTGILTSNVEFSGDAPLHGAASAGTQGYTSGDERGD